MPAHRAQRQHQVNAVSNVSVNSQVSTNNNIKTAVSPVASATSWFANQRYFSCGSCLCGG